MLLLLLRRTLELKSLWLLTAQKSRMFTIESNTDELVKNTSCATLQAGMWVLYTRLNMMLQSIKCKFKH